MNPFQSRKSDTRLKELAKKLWSDYLATLPQAQQGQPLPIDVGTTTTTNFEKAALRVRRDVMWTCPLLVVVATPDTWNGEPYRPYQP